MNKIFLSHKLRCYTEISGPKKSRNNTREKIRYFFTCVDIANQLLTRHSPLAPLGQVDEWTAKPSRFSIWVICWSFLELWRRKHLNPYRWQTVRLKNHNTQKKNRKLRIQWLWCWHFSRLRTKIDNWKICHWKTSSVGKDKVNKWEFCKLKITIIVVFVIMIQRIFPS